MPCPRSVSPLSRVVSLGVVAVAFAAGCQEHLITTPYVARRPEAAQAFESLDPSLKTPSIPVMYVTDRAAEPGSQDDVKGVRYGHKRSSRLAYGEALVKLDPEPTWGEMVTLSTSGARTTDYTLSVEDVHELGSFEPVASLLEPHDGELVPRADANEVAARQQAAFCAELTRWLERTQRKEVAVFVHGFNNTFDDAVIRLAQAWHFAGRQGVPIVYTWPAGIGGILGYGYDRESGEFTVLHLKMLLRALALCPGVERVHLISHSRGTDVATTALRELNAEIRGLTGATPLTALVPEDLRASTRDGTHVDHRVADILKLETLVLAAPDLDVDVFSQRFVNENMLGVARRTIIYFSNEDDALGWARWLFGSSSRLGALDSEAITPQVREMLRQLPCIELINCDVSGYTTHAYVFQHPAALSDFILAIRDRAQAGTDANRPLEHDGPGVWLITNDYLRPKEHD